MNKEELIYILKKHHLRPKRENGQNFLVNPQTVEKLINAAELKPDDIVLEIGAGLGTVTSALCQKVKKVIACEIDQDFLPVLHNLAMANKNLEIVNNDIFKIDFSKVGNAHARSLQEGHFKIVSSLPYNITSLFFRNFLEHGPRPKLISVIIQKEVAERIVAKPGQMSLLALSVQLFGEPQIIRIIPKSDFYPKPDVESAILQVKVGNAYTRSVPAHARSVPDIDLKSFFQLLRIGFAAKRKKLSSNLENGLKIEKKIITEGFKKLNLSENCRAQELSLEQWVWIFDYTKKFML